MDGAAEAEVTVVGDADRVLFILRDMDQGDWAEQLFTISRRSFRNVGHDGGLYERPVSFAADQKFRPRRN